MLHPLKDAPLRSPLKLSLGDADADTSRRLAALGLRPGAVFQLLQKTAGGGRVAQFGQSRVAIGAELAAQLEAEG
jgi:Fe2+ transport system protein FeoA